MSDNKNIKAPQDAKKINLKEEYEVQYWTKSLNVTKEELNNAVANVGVAADKVKEFLKSKK